MSVREGRAVVFVYALGPAPAGGLNLKGLDASRRYRVREIDLMPGAKGGETTATGAELMKEGLPVGAMGAFTSAVFAVEGD